MKNFSFIITVFNLTDWLNKILFDKYIDKINLEMNKLIQYIFVCMHFYIYFSKYKFIYKNTHIYIKLIYRNIYMSIFKYINKCIFHKNNRNV